MVERFERCFCTGVDRALVIEAVRRERCRTFDHLRRASGACYGCQSCRPELEALLEELWSRAEHATDRIERAAAEAADPERDGGGGDGGGQAPPGGGTR